MFVLHEAERVAPEDREIDIAHQVDGGVADGRRRPRVIGGAYHALAAVRLDDSSDIVAARCWVGVSAEAVRSPPLFARVRRLLDTEIDRIRWRSGDRFTASEAGAVLAFVRLQPAIGAGRAPVDGVKNPPERVFWLPNSSTSKNFSSCLVIDLGKVRQERKQLELHRKPKAHQASVIEQAIEWQRQLDAGEVETRAAIARREGLNRARVTQVMNQFKKGGR